MSLLRPASCQQNSHAKLPLIDDDDDTQGRSKKAKLIGPERWSWKYLIFITALLLVISLILSIFCVLVWSDVNICLWFDRSDSDGCVSLFHPIADIVQNSEEHYKLNEYSVLSDQCSNIPKNLRFDCHPENGASMLTCTARGCCWDTITEQNNKKLAKPPLNVPYCYYPEKWSLYNLKNETREDDNYTAFWEISRDSFYKKDIKLMRMHQGSVNDDIVHVMISDADEVRYQPHLPIINHPWGSSSIVENPQYSFETASDSPGFRIRRNSENTTVFDGIVPNGFIFSNQFLQISGLLPTNNIYGLGEHRTNLKLNTNWQILTMFNKDQPPTENANLYGSHPFYLVIEESGNCHGVLFLNSNAMDVILQPTPAITFRSIGGIFDMYFFMGPTAADVIRQYSEIVGKPFMPPYWSLGFHLCRYGYGSLDKTIEVWNRTRVAGIPFDTQWNDLDYMDRNDDFTYDKKQFKDLPNFVEKLHQLGMKYIPLIDAGIPSERPYPPLQKATEEGLLIKYVSNSDAFKGKVWNEDGTVWPDFTSPHTVEYWQEMMNDLWMMFRYDGAWIDMNEPSNFYNGDSNGCDQSELDYPPYVPNVVGNLLATKTLCMNARHFLGDHYDIHNTHGTSEAVMTSEALAKIRQHRPFVISRSTWVGHGAYAGHWSGDIYSSWHDMRMSVPQLLSFSLFQIPMMGADICGFDGNTTQSLCNRWMQLGAFYPFSRNHNSDDTIEQDPVAMGELVVKSSRKALMIRYRLLPYLYTLFFRAHVFGDTVARPLFFEFQNDSSTYELDSQFLWGSSLMIVPVFEEGATQVTAYLPRGIWYDFYDKQSLNSTGRNYTLAAPLDTIPLLVRGGSILPAQTPATTTTASRNNDFELIIAPDEGGFAKGELYWDDGDSIDAVETSNSRWLEFTLDNQTVNVREVHPGEYDGKMILGKVEVMGIIKSVNKVSINEKEVEFVYNKIQAYLIVKDLQVDLRKPFTLTWK